MKTSCLAFIISFVIAIGGCALAADPRLVGTYRGPNSDLLEFHPDAGVFRIRSKDGQPERIFVGYMAASSSTPSALNFVGPDTSRFVGTSIKIDDYSAVIVDWHDLRDAGENRTIRYERARDNQINERDSN